MRCVSLFSGVGLLDLGAQRAGAEIVAQVEIEPYARRVLKARFPGVMRYDDVRAVSAAQLLAFGAVDLIAGGFPCQDVSSAGRRRGLDGERSGLWSEFARLIGETRPRWVLIENVARLRNDGLDRVLGDLAARGYDAEWDVVGAAAVGAPHLRERIWIVAWDASRVRLPNTLGDGVRAERERRREQRGEPGSGVAGNDGALGRVAGLADGDGDGRAGLGLGALLDGEREAPGDDADRRGADVADTEGERRHEGPGPDRRSEGEGRGRAELGGCGGPFRLFDADHLRWWRERCECDAWPRDEAGAEPGLGRAPDGGSGGVDARPVLAWERGAPRSLSPAEAAERRLLGERRSNRLKAIGNGVVPQIVEWIVGRIVLADRLFGGTTR